VVPELIESRTRFAALLEQLRTEPLVALDTEAASFHRFRDRVYLLQLSSRGETWIVDPLAVEGLPGLGELLAQPAVELVFHDADYDLRLLGHEFGYRASNLFDTRIAAQFLNEPGTGLAALLEKYFGVRQDKRFQRADWSARPLTPAQLDYAATDTRHLPALRDELRTRLKAMGRLAWVEEECELLTAVRWPEPIPFEEEAVQAKGARGLTPRGLAVFRELYVWRAELAQTLDRAAFRIAGNEVLLALAQKPAASVAELSAVRGMGRDLAGRRGKEILAAIRRGLSLPDDRLPRYPRPVRHRSDPAVDARLERLKVARNALAARHELPAGVVAPNWLLEGIARRAPASLEDLGEVGGIRRWQVEVLGPDLLKAV
jgi:ribonuclease D